MSSDRREPILLVCHLDPWADTFGARMRLRMTFDALAGVAPVDVAVMSPEPPGQPPVEGGPRRVIYLSSAAPRLTVPGRLGWLISAAHPLELLGRRLDDVRASLASWLAPSYSLIWAVRSRTLDAVAPVLPAAPVVLDFDDLDSEKLATRLDNQAFNPTGSDPPATRVKQLLLRVQARRNVQAWRRFEQRQAQESRMCVVCSDADASVLSAGNIRVVPNAYRIPDRPVGRSIRGTPPTIVLHGLLTYAPNVDAAGYFVGQILPRVKDRVPDVRLRLVGKAGNEVRRLHNPPEVTVTGYVPSIEDELARADLIVVPIRYGGGTRIKILEALAHRIPVVSTSIGAHGLALEDGEQALIRDEPVSFADACAGTLVSDDLRGRLTAAGARHVERYFSHDATVARIRTLVDEVRLVRSPG